MGKLISGFSTTIRDCGLTVLREGQTLENPTAGNLGFWTGSIAMFCCCKSRLHSFRFCPLFPFQSIKTVRLRLNLTRALVEDPSLNVKVLLLVRDPRGTMQSRKHRVNEKNKKSLIWRLWCRIGALVTLIVMILPNSVETLSRTIRLLNSSVKSSLGDTCKMLDKILLYF